MSQPEQPHPTELGTDPQAQDQSGTIEAVAPIVQTSRPDAHTQRYDRQLRLWASSGQASLESAHVLLIGATHLGAQVLKNLILPGIGSFTVLDAQTVGPYDLGNNFFVDPTSEGRSRAEQVSQLLAELNPQVRSAFKAADAAHLLVADPSFFLSFSLIIAVNQPPGVLGPLAELAWQGTDGICVPLITVRGAGMAGEVSIQTKDLGIIETHPASTVDLRLTSPWPELLEYANSYDLDTRDAMAHSHSPFVVILLRALENWKGKNDGAFPVPSKDRKAFAESINALRDPSNSDLENFDEAIAALGQNVWRPITSGRRIPEDVQALFDDPSCGNVTAKSTNFWILVRALKSFVAAPTTACPSGGGGSLPLPGSLPDFKATSSGYIELQRLYKLKAQRDLQGLQGHLDEVLQEAGLPAGSISNSEVESFAKHAGFLKFIRGKSLKDRLNNPANEDITMAFFDPVNPSTIQNHVAFLAVDEFHNKHRRFPGSSRLFSDSITGSTSSSLAANINGSTKDENSPSSSYRTPTVRGPTSEPDKKRQRSNSPFAPRDIVGNDCDGDSQMKEASKATGVDVEEASIEVIADERNCLREAETIMSRLGIEDEEHRETIENAVKEMVRSGHGDLASTASLLGGVAAQEAIKIITKQYIPLDNTAVYDGIKQAIGSFQL